MGKKINHFLFLQSKNIVYIVFIFYLASNLSACHDEKKIDKNSAVAAKKINSIDFFKERCKSSGFKFFRSANNVEGILLLKVRPRDINYDDQFKMDDPYGHDLGGDGYIMSFLRGSYQANTGGRSAAPGDPERVGYNFVDVIDPLDHRRYRYTGEVREHEVEAGPISGPKRKFLTTEFVMDRKLATHSAPRYGVTYSDISTREDREFWIAGSSLRVIDLENNEVIAERVGYMIDLQQGSQAGMRSPWLIAAENACPGFGRGSYSRQARQTQDFVEQVLHPKQ